MKRLFITVLSLALLVGLFAVPSLAAETSETCGDSLTWTFDSETATLAISGEGEMENWPTFFDVPWRAYNNDVLTITINEGVTSVGQYAFRLFRNVENVSLPSSLTSINGYSFIECYSLKQITIPDSVTSIGDHAFAHCKSLETVILPSHLETVESYAFWDCAALEEINIPEGTKRLRHFSFRGSGLTKIHIPSSVCGDIVGALSPCPDLTEITVDPSNAEYSSVNGLLLSKDGSELLLCPLRMTDLEIPSTVTSVLCSFYDMYYDNPSALTSVSIPDSVTYIGNYAFANCPDLASVSIPDSVTDMGYYVFENCAALTDVTLSKSLTELPSETFSGCSSLTDISIPEGIKVIGRNAFSDCVSLVSISLPSTLERIGPKAFLGSGLKTVRYNGTEEEWDKLAVADSNQELSLAEIKFLAKPSGSGGSSSGGSGGGSSSSRPSIKPSGGGSSVVDKTPTVPKQPVNNPFSPFCRLLSERIKSFVSFMFHPESHLTAIK